MRLPNAYPEYTERARPLPRPTGSPGIRRILIGEATDDGTLRDALFRASRRFSRADRSRRCRRMPRGLYHRQAHQIEIDADTFFHSSNQLRSMAHAHRGRRQYASIPRNGHKIRMRTWFVEWYTDYCETSKCFRRVAHRNNGRSTHGIRDSVFDTPTMATVGGACEEGRAVWCELWSARATGGIVWLDLQSLQPSCSMRWSRGLQRDLSNSSERVFCVRRAAQTGDSVDQSATTGVLVRHEPKDRLDGMAAYFRAK